MQYGHGGDIYSASQPVLDYSANLNPLGMPPAVRAAAEASVAAAGHYPDPLCRGLTAGIAARDGVGAERVLCGSGAADLIFRLVWAERPRRALVTAPTFSEYAQALRAAGTEVCSHRLRREDGFDLTESVLDDLTEEVDMAFLCTPNNPTGRTVEAGLMAEILERCAAKHIRLLVDECFLELSDAGEGRGLTENLERYPNLVLLRAFTKSYAIPGLRLGYCLAADGDLLERMNLCAPAWAVSVPAQAAGLAALSCPDWPRRARTLIRTERERLLAAMETMGLSVWRGSANYILFEAAGNAALKEQMLERGVLIRSCANYDGLGSDYYRVAVRTREENDILLKTLRAVLTR